MNNTNKLDRNPITKWKIKALLDSNAIPITKIAALYGVSYLCLVKYIQQKVSKLDPAKAPILRRNERGPSASI